MALIEQSQTSQDDHAPLREAIKLQRREMGASGSGGEGEGIEGLMQ